MKIHIISCFFIGLATTDAFIASTKHVSLTSRSTTKDNYSRNVAFNSKPKLHDHGTKRKHYTSIHARSEDNLVSGIAEIGIGFSLGVLWSEYSIIVTGCGPLNFSDTLERICYQGVILISGLAVFNRIVTGKGLDDSSLDFFGPLEDFTLIQVRIAEYASLLAVLGAFVALAFQESRGVDMDGLSGIDVEMCRAWRDL